MNHETYVNMAAINKNKTESMECSYLKLSLFLFSASRAVWREYKEKHLGRIVALV